MRLIFPRETGLSADSQKEFSLFRQGKRAVLFITTLNAMYQNREVFAPPGKADSPKSDCTNRLIQQSAKLVLKVEDILSEFQLQIPPKQVELLPDLSSKENSVFKQLSHEPIHIDQLCIQMKKDTPEVLSTLLLLELRNLVQQHPEKLFTKSV